MAAAAAAAAGAYHGFQPTTLGVAATGPAELWTSFIRDFTNVEKAQFNDGSFTMAGDQYPRNAEMSCDLPIYFSEKMGFVGEGEERVERVESITWVRTISLQDMVTKTDDGRMLNSWTAQYTDDAQQPKGISAKFIVHRDALNGFDNCTLMKINCDFLTSSKGMMENHLRKFHNIILSQVDTIGADGGGVPEFRLKQSNDLPPPKLPPHPSKLTIKICKEDYKYHSECIGLLRRSDSECVEKNNWQGMIKLFRHLLTEDQYNNAHMGHDVLRFAKKRMSPIGMRYSTVV